MKKLILALFVSTNLVGCATQTPFLPTDYVGPTASISDHGINESGSKGQLFYVEAIDGQAVTSGLEKTRRASSGHGFSLALSYSEHAIPIRPLRVKIVATHVTGAPIHEIASRAAGTFFGVEGEVTLTPVAGHQYFVSGKLLKEGSSVWIADAVAEDVPVTTVVNSRQSK